MRSIWRVTAAACSDSMSSVSRKMVRTEMPDRSAMSCAVGDEFPDSIRSNSASTARSNELSLRRLRPSHDVVGLGHASRAGVGATSTIVSPLAGRLSIVSWPPERPNRTESYSAVSIRSRSSSSSSMMTASGGEACGRTARAEEFLCVIGAERRGRAELPRRHLGAAPTVELQPRWKGRCPAVFGKHRPCAPDALGRLGGAARRVRSPPHCSPQRSDHPQGWSLTRATG